MININTNQGAMVALQTLNRTNDQLDKTQNTVATGLKIASAKDNGAIWAIANKMRSDVTAYDRVRESADRAASILDTGIAAAESIMELLNDMKGKALAASAPGLSTASLSALNADFVALRDQIVSVVENATFDGANMIRNFQANGTTANTVNDAISFGDAAGGNNITVTGAGMQLRATTAAVAVGEIMRFGQNETIVAGGAAALTTVGLINTSIDNLGTRLATWGAGAKRLDSHRTFVSKLQDALTSGIGSLVDADLAKESAKLQALQVKQQLGVQALSIANRSSQTALSLFR